MRDERRSYQLERMLAIATRLAPDAVAAQTVHFVQMLFLNKAFVVVRILTPSIGGTAGAVRKFPERTLAPYKTAHIRPIANVPVPRKLAPCADGIELIMPGRKAGFADRLAGPRAGSD